MIKIIFKTPLYQSFRNFDWPKMLPMNLTIGVSYRCNSRCLTCHAWKKKSEELTTKEWDKIFKSLDRAPYWFTFSGGEPFLRQDLVEIIKSAYYHCQPGIINVPTNGLFEEEFISQKVKEIVESCSGSQIIINLSLDGVGGKHDKIRGVPGSFEKAIKSFQALRKLKYANLAIGIHSVISKFNVDDIPEIYNFILNLKPDSYITEIAEERVELDTVGMDITPSLEKYSKAVDFLIEKNKKQNFKRIAKIIQAFRKEYYQMVKKILKEKRQIIPCYAGFASAQISPGGEVWPCCIKAENLGNLREVNYDFKKIWFGKKAEQVRKRIKNKKCYCPLANVSYTNMILNPQTLLKVVSKII